MEKKVDVQNVLGTGVTIPVPERKEEKMEKFLDVIDDMLDDAVLAKRIKYKRLNQFLNSKYDKMNYKLIFENINFGKIQDYADINYCTFYFREVPVTIATYYFDNIENNEEIGDILSERLKIQIEKIQSINRIVTGILVGFECESTGTGYILRRDFNHYLHWMVKNNFVEKEKYNPEAFISRFIQQTADTEENRRAVRDVCYAYSKDDHKWGIRQIDSMILIREIVRKYATIDIYNLVNKKSDIKIGYQSFISMILLVENLLLEFES